MHKSFALGLAPLPSATNFLFVPVDEPESVNASLLRAGVVVRAYSNGIRFNVRDREDDDLLLDALARALDRPSPTAQGPGRRVPPGFPADRAGVVQAHPMVVV